MKKPTFVDLVYPILIFCAGIFALPYILYMSIRRKKYRHGWKQKLFGAVPELSPTEGDRKRLWLHGVSVGEVNLLKPIVRELEKRRPDWEYVVSATSETGYELAKKLFGDRAPVFYCPLDFKPVVDRAVRRLKPDLLVLVELELWPGLVRAANDAGVRVAIVNGRISDKSFKRYRLVKRALAPTFRRIDLVAAQDEIAAGYFKALSPCPELVSVVGSVKFDGVQTNRANSATERLAKLAGIESDDVVFLAGSTQDPEESGALETYRRLYRDFPKLKLILVPRHRERFEEVAKLLDESEFTWTRRSTLQEGARPQLPKDAAPNADPRRILLVDAIGELGAWWGTAAIAFVGGSWGNRGGQNMLEPAGYGAAVSFGPNTRNFRVVSEALLSAKGAVVVANVDEMEAFVRRCLLEPEYRRSLGAAAQSLTLRNAGASERTVAALETLLS